MAILTQEEKHEQVILCRTLGDIFPLFGVVEPSPGVLCCECGTQDCKNPGKHPRWRNYRQRATSDLELIRGWLQKYPNANFGVVTSATTLAVDADVRIDANGLATLEYLQIDEGVRLPYTVEVVTGRGNGSRHFYFNAPPSARIRTRAKVLPGVDIRAEGGYCVAAGSRHINGGYYVFAPDCRPDEQAVATAPDFLLIALAESSPTSVSLAPPAPFGATLTEAATPLPDRVALGIILRDHVARFYWNGGRRNGTPSEDDFALACKLAFYCRHDLHQMYRLFLQSGLYRNKFDAPRKGGDYALRTLKKAILATPQTWIRKKRTRPSIATGAKKGRKIVASTQAVLDLHRSDPTLSAIEIAVKLELKPRQVRDAIRYHVKGETENAWTLIHSKGTGREPQVDSGLVSGELAA
jgi:hypothetical protein